MESWRELKSFIDTIPTIDTHEHFKGITKPIDNIPVFLADGWYTREDLANAAGSTELLIQPLMDESRALDERFKLFIKWYDLIKNTSYADAFRRGLKLSWGIDVTLNGLFELHERKHERTQTFHDSLIEKANIKAGISNIFSDDTVLAGSKDYAEWCRFAISVPDWHTVKKREDIRKKAGLMLNCKSSVNTLDDYVDAMEICISRCKSSGNFVAIKDQSAYLRKIEFGNSTRQDAESVFNRIMFDARYSAGEAEALPLSNYLFHRVVSLAEKYDLPFQMHTGHLAGLYGNITNSNAADFIPVLEMYPNVTFDLFHGNWPYMGEYLYIGKSYPNAVLNLCWVQSIESDYSIELMRRAVLTMPTSKILAFGGDCSHVEFQIGALDQARENVAKALFSLIADERIDFEEAKRIAYDWFFHNPNKIYKLGLC
jgi:uncharacterized protein